MPRTSIIIPTHNRATLLQAAINSAQKAGRDVQVVVVDDASTDETAAICRNLNGIKYLRLERNVGLARARNVGIRNSSGEFVAFLDDDDQRLPGSVDKQEELLSRNESVSFVYGKVLIADPVTYKLTGKSRPRECPVGDIFWLLCAGNFIYVPSVLARKRSVEAIGMFDPDPGLRGTEDWDAWIRLAENSDVDALDEPVAIYRDFSPMSGQMSSNRPRMCNSTARTLSKALRSPRALAAGTEKSAKLWADCINGLWENLVSEGHLALSTRRYRYAAQNFIAAARLNPQRATRVTSLARFIGDAVGALKNEER